MQDVGPQPTHASSRPPPLRGYLTLGRGSLVWEATTAERPSLKPTAAALAYWNEMVTGMRLPDRGAIEPWRIANLLPMVFFARQCRPQGRWCYTLIGGCLEAVVGYGRTRRPLGHVFPGRRTAGGISRLYSAVADERRVQITRAAISAKGDVPWEVPRRFNLEAVHMPVLDRGGDVIIFGVCAFDRPVRPLTTNPSAL